MSGLSDLLRGAKLTPNDGELPDLMVGKVIDTAPLRVTVNAIDGGALARTVFGSYPDAAAGDEVRVKLDETGGLVLVAWEPA